jgi:L-threonylcarbamoyladenylate synthase
MIQNGEVVAFPTETVYGLGADALNAEAVDKIFVAKGRPSNDPFIIHLSDPTQLNRVARAIPRAAYPLIEKFWPGPLTLILSRSENLPLNVTARLPTVAVRMPAHPVAVELIRLSGVPIAAPSANRFAYTSPTTAAHVYADLAGRIPLILDGGASTIGVESTIVDLGEGRPRLLRPGGVTAEQLRSLLPNLEVVERYITPESVGALTAPGQLLKHYAPTAELWVVEGDYPAMMEMLRREVEKRVAAGQKAGVLIGEGDQALFQGLEIEVEVLGDALSVIAQRLFGALRRLDERGVGVIFARSFPQIGIGLAIRDRLFRAASGRVMLASKNPPFLE